MITSEQFEAHVRAMAEREYPDDDGCPTGPYTAPSKRTIWEREVYIAARMEHEWPLMEALQKLIDEINPYSHYGDGGWRKVGLPDGVGSKTMPNDAVIIEAIAALSPYTAKPIEP